MKTPRLLNPTHDYGGLSKATQSQQPQQIQKVQEAHVEDDSDGPTWHVEDDNNGLSWQNCSPS